MMDKSVALSEVEAVKKSVVESVEWVESGSRGVVDGAGGGFDDGLDVRFVLVYECLSGVHVECSE